MENNKLVYEWVVKIQADANYDINEITPKLNEYLNLMNEKTPLDFKLKRTIGHVIKPIKIYE